MKKITLILLLIAMSCGVKQTTNLVNSGDYDAAIDKAVNNLRSNKNAKGKQEYVYLLEEAFAKAKERDLREVTFMKKDANPRNFETIFNTYLNLQNRQEKIRPLLPLFLIKENRNAIFPFEDYSNEIIKSKELLSKYLYDNAKALLMTNDKMVIRRAFDDLSYLNQINPNYKDVQNLMNQALEKGTDYVEVLLKNETNMMIPRDLQNDLLDFSTLGLNDQWTVYHSTKQRNRQYDYGVVVNFRQINISPEQIREKQFVKEKQIKDGVKNLLDQNGNIVKDSLGNAIKVDNMKTVKIDIYEFTQFKAVQVAAKVDYVDYVNNQLMSSFPLTSEFIFENIYSNYKGDKRAADESYFQYFNNRVVPFPSNEQMVFDTGEDLKLKLKQIIGRNKIRRQ
ncbi:hypothetical protein GV828_12325 [Flavobacterium sp. NST-5]|uniref:Lipoprotein n=1 Tax=Flavobacterium ichthyis TaxID=2698827 RepID=A0ABW9ZFW9_9FLAO|nr:hypothetical protein [Flavobacterium ichthyis]NBL65985.1 hypothetical protein [Flavobacterium ichthyis]